MQNKFILQYTIYGDIEKPVHQKYEFEYDGDLLAALDHGACQVLDLVHEKLGDNTDIILRGITQENAQEYYKYLTQPMNGDKDE